MTYRTAKVVLSIAALIIIVSGPAFSQAGHGKGRLGGTVVDPEGKPMAGLKVTLTFAENKGLVFETTTGKKGDWAFLGLGTGNWFLGVTGPGFEPFEKMVNVSQLAVNPKIQVVLKKAEKASGVLSDEKSVEFLESGNQLYKDGNYDEAIAAYQKFLEANPGLYQIQVSIADCYREKGEYDKAMGIYNEVITQSASDLTLGREMAAKSLAGIGNCYLKQGKLEEAQGFFQKSIETSPKDEILAYNVGEIFFSNQKLDEAIRYFEMAIQIKSTWPKPYYRLGLVYLNKGDFPKAIENLNKFVELDPQNPEVPNVKNTIAAIEKMKK
jgi:tetratricopeptide (TPR) repeat protein